LFRFWQRSQFGKDELPPKKGPNFGKGIPLAPSSGYIMSIHCAETNVKGKTCTVAKLRTAYVAI
jgi:hypothetical protein